MFASGATERRAGLWVGLATAALLSACAGEQTPEERVMARAQDRLELLMAGDFEESMRYTTPSYRQSRTLDYYTRAFLGAAGWEDVEVVEAVCDNAACDVTYKLTYPTLQSGLVNTRTMAERWIQVDGDWFIYLK